MFGTDGIRGKATDSLFSEDSLFHLGYSLIELTQEARGRFDKELSKTLTVIIGIDGRESGPRIAQSLMRGITAAGGLTTEPLFLPTPAICAAVISGHYNLGIMVSASHNEATDNGLKFFTNSGKLTPDFEKKLTERYRSRLSNHPSVGIGETIPSSATMTPDRLPLTFSYETFIRQKLGTYPDLSKLTIALDCAHGALSEIAPRFLRSLGATVITVGTEPTGTNINKDCGSCHPETLKALMLSSTVAAIDNRLITESKQAPDFGFAFDGDGDRIIAIDSYNYGNRKNQQLQSTEILFGEHILALLLQSDEFSHESAVVTTVVSNSGFDSYCKKIGRNVVIVPVGDKHVIKSMELNNIELGGESSGHILFKSYLPCSDGLYAALKIIAATLQRKSEYIRYTPAPVFNRTIPAPLRKELTSPECAAILENHKKALPKGRFLIRYSGTEPVLRIIVEADDFGHAEERGNALAEELSAFLLAPI